MSCTSVVNIFHDHCRRTVGYAGERLGPRTLEACLHHSARRIHHSAFIIFFRRFVILPGMRSRSLETSLEETMALRLKEGAQYLRLQAQKPQQSYRLGMASLVSLAISRDPCFYPLPLP